ncbi:mRNA interferase [Bacteroidia bacterium]|nr:mRNA interferase [Bacteroidia bacterium]
MKQGEIWLINLDPTVGAEMKKTRPALIINNDTIGKLPLKIIVPVTDWKDRYEIAPWMIKIIPNLRNGLVKESSIDCFQIRSVAEERLIKCLGRITRNEILQVQEGITKVIGYQ